MIAGVPENLVTVLIASLEGFEWANSNRISPLAAMLLLAFGLVVANGSRRGMLAMLILIAVVMPPAQRLVIGGLDFPLLRLAAIIGLFRQAVTLEVVRVRWSWLDLMVIGIGLFGLLGMTVRLGSSGFVTSSGKLADLIGVWAVLRTLICSRRDWTFAMQCMGAMAIGVMAFMFVERQTGRNVFSLLGGVPEITQVRNGRVRCQAAFSHPILAGSFFAAWFPVFLGFALAYRRGVAWWWFVVASLGVVLLAASSTPLSGVIIALAGWATFGVRRYLGVIRWSLLLIAVGLHFALNNGIWSVFAKIDLVGGSTGWHRFALIRATGDRIGEWWAFGVNSTDHWGPGLWDLTNQYVVDGAVGGIGAMLLRMASIVFAFVILGRRLRRIDATGTLKTDSPILYGMGVGLLVHVCIMLSVSYFGQAYLGILLLLAGIASVPCWSDGPVRFASPLATTRVPPRTLGVSV